MKNFEETIQAHLMACAATDEEFAIKLDAGMNGDKPISKCCEYIMAEVQKNAKGNRSVAVEDNEVYGMAKHFYIEDNIVIPAVRPNASVSLGDPKAGAIQKASEEYTLTDEDMAEVRQIAMERAIADMKRANREKASAKKEEPKGHPQLSLFD